MYAGKSLIFTKMHFKNQCKEITLPNNALQQNMSSVDPKGECPDPPVW